MSARVVVIELSDGNHKPYEAARITIPDDAPPVATVEFETLPQSYYALKNARVVFADQSEATRDPSP